MFSRSHNVQTFINFKFYFPFRGLGMGKIDWYILKNFLVTFVFCMLLFMVVAVAVDTSEKADDFVKTGLSTYDFIKQY